ncbi:TPA: flagellar basal body L-ring protein FlgH [Candidatus Poribacteria bacterium]|nr:flagellar basal body L-ring protein FlgH [Candidatus Poribacteria bacterium]
MKKTVVIIFIFLLSFYEMMHADERGTERHTDFIQTSQFTTQTQIPPSLFSDLKASRVGDIVTVLVLESASAKKNVTTKTSKSSSRSISSSLDPVNGLLESESAHNGSGSTFRSGEITAKVPAIVTQVLPNGNLLIVGKRELILNKDKEVISVRGIVRRQDINASNTVLSTQLAEAQIQYEGDGFISKQQRPGLLGRILDWIWIF